MSRRLLTLLTILGLLAAAPTPAAAEDPWIRLPGTQAQLNDLVDAPVQVDGYATVGDGPQKFYKRRGGTFVKVTGSPEDLSPDGRWRVAWRYPRGFRTPLRKITLIDRRSDRRATIRLPVDTGAPRWSPDSRSLLLTAYRPVTIDGTSIYSRTGFVTVSVADRRVRVVKVRPAVVPAEVDLYGRFSWTPDGKSVLGNLQPGRLDYHSLALYDLRGARKRVYEDVGEVAYIHSPAPFSPSGRLFATKTQKPFGGEDSIRVVDLRTGDVLFHRAADLLTDFYGWYDENHLILSYLDKNMAMTYKVVDFSGEPGITLIKGQGPVMHGPPVLWRLYLTRR